MIYIMSRDFSLCSYQRSKEQLVAKSHYGVLLAKESSAKKRVELFLSFIDSLAQEKNHKIGRVVVNLLCLDPLRWFPRQISILEALSVGMVRRRAHGIRTAEFVQNVREEYFSVS